MSDENKSPFDHRRLNELLEALPHLFNQAVDDCIRVVLDQTLPIINKPKENYFVNETLHTVVKKLEQLKKPIQ